MACTVSKNILSTKSVLKLEWSHEKQNEDRDNRTNLLINNYM